MLNLQRTFNRVLAFMRVQRKRSMRPTKYEYSAEQCLYRGPGGLVCGAGCAFPDELYDRKMESRPVDHLVKRFARLEPYLGKPGSRHLHMMKAIQEAHDQAMPDKKGGSMEAWEYRMGEIAEAYKLKYWPPKEK